MGMEWVMSLVDVMVPFFGLIVAGWISCRFFLLSGKQSGAVNHFLFNVCLPALAFRHIVHNGVYSVDWHFVGVYAAFKVACFFILLIAEMIMHRFKFSNKPAFFAQTGMLYITVAFPNAVIIGNPLLMSLFNNDEKKAVLAIVTLFADEWVVVPLTRVFLELYEAKKKVQEQEQQGAAAASKLETTTTATTTTTAAGAAEELKDIVVPSPSSTSSSEEQAAAPAPAPAPSAKKTESNKSAAAAGASGGHGSTIKWKELLQHIFLHPLVIAIVSGSLYSAMKLPFPTPVEKAMELLSSCVTGSAMLMIGVFIYQNGGQMLSKNTILPLLGYLFSRFIFAPFLMLGVAWALQLRGSSAQIAVLLTALPPAVTAFVMGTQYKLKRETNLASGVITLGMFLVFPLLLAYVPLVQLVFPTTTTLDDSVVVPINSTATL